jgi:osmotically-inducible protein OsmY
MAASLLACSTARPPEARLDGTALESGVKSALARDGRLARATSVDVNPATGVVTLSGRVTSPEERASAGRLASSVEGVKIVYNEIEIQRARR